MIDLTADAVQLEKNARFPLLTAAKKKKGYLHLDATASFIFFKREDVTVCHVSAILTPAGNGLTVVIDSSALLRWVVMETDTKALLWKITCSVILDLSRAPLDLPPSPRLFDDGIVSSRAALM